MTHDEIEKMMTKEGPVFEIRDGDKHYKIYESGWIEGFGENACVYNYLYKLCSPRISEHFIPTGAQRNDPSTWYLNEKK